MVDKTNGVGPIANQTFSKKGVKLSDLKENKLLFDYFKKAGLDENNYVFESDIKNIQKAYDENGNGKLSKKEARAMFGEDVSRKDIKRALKGMKQIAETEISNKDNLIPTKISENETSYYDNEGKLIQNEMELENGGVYQRNFYQGDPEKLSGELFEQGDDIWIKKYQDGDINKPIEEYSLVEGKETKVNYEYNEQGLLIAKKQNSDGNVVDTKYVYTEGDKLDHIIETGNGKKTTYIYAGNDPKLGAARIVEEDGNFIKVTENTFENGHLSSQTVEGGRDLAKEGISKQIKYYDEAGKEVIKTESYKTDGSKIVHDLENNIKEEVISLKPEEKDKVHQDKTSGIKAVKHTPDKEHKIETEGEYKVQKGETVAQIAKKLGVSTEALLAANRHYEAKSGKFAGNKYFYADQVINIPKAKVEAETKKEPKPAGENTATTNPEVENKKGVEEEQKTAPETVKRAPGFMPGIEGAPWQPRIQGNPKLQKAELEIGQEKAASDELMKQIPSALGQITVARNEQGAIIYKAFAGPLAGREYESIDAIKAALDLASKGIKFQK